jgi:hypothetical protein
MWWNERGILEGLPMVFERETQAYLREKERLLAKGERGRFALVKGDEVIGVWDTARDAAQAGYEKFGVREPFMVKEVQAEEKPLFLTPFFPVKPCPSTTEPS